MSAKESYVRMFADMVADGRRKLEDVPEKYRAEVKALLDGKKEEGGGK